ncbi:MAG TPA: cell division protein FtsZ [Rhizomicrobium sp.]|jgi:cell division protein FtsZ|nr:cell division protein FtsZ [Rhizomicrobium sp.]
MAIKIGAPSAGNKDLRPRITVLGVGGAGGNAVNNMIASKLEGVEFVVANTDAQALQQSLAERKIQIGALVTEGLGAGAQPDIGRAGAEESLEEILDALQGSHMVFITGGMGGGTGTGAAPVIARAVREAGILTVGVVTKPFAFEGDRRMRMAEKGIAELQQYVHTLIVIPNQNLFRVANDRTTLAHAFSMADDVLHAGVRGVTDLIVMPGLINLDFADIKAVITEMGKAMMGTGEAEGEDRAIKAADMAISNPLLDDVSMKGARGILINVTGGPDLMLFEVEAAANRIRAEVDPDANIIFGSTIVDDMEGRIRVSVVATGMEAELARMPQPKVLAAPLGTNVKKLPREILEEKIAAAGLVKPGANPVHKQVEAIAREMEAAPAPMMTEAEELILGDADMVEIPGDAMPAPTPVPQPVVHTLSTPLRTPEPEPERRGWFGIGRRKAKSDEPLRSEPMAAPRQAAQPLRAQAQVMRSEAQQPQRTAQQPQQATPTDDLFGEHKGDEQFEIPAFLRRQQS